MLPELVIATHNQGKLKEFRDLLSPYVASIASAGELNLPEPVEDGGTFVANALIKAQAAAMASGKPALADDSGICINALEGGPGVDTASWTKRGLEGLQELHDEMEGNPDTGATCVCVLALVHPDGWEQVFEGRVHGEIVWPPHAGGFGYDGMFKPNGHDQTYAEMGKEKKNTLSHRAMAFAKLAEFLRSGHAPADANEEE